MAFTQQMPIGTPDVNLITKTLAGLRPDSALQEYAALHKNNPYILSLAKLESDRRKSLRTAAQGQAGPQPTVADREIAGMAPAPMMAQTRLPEDQGIAQIPAPNMRTLANGGIAGYEDDEEGMATGGMGGMFNFAQQSEPVVRMSGGGVARYNGATGSVTGVAPELLSKYQQEATEMAMGTRMQFSPDVKAVVGKIQAAQEGSYLKEEQKQMLEGNPLRNKTQDSASMVAPTASAAYDPTENLKKLAQTNARYTTPSAPKNAEEAAMLNRYPATKPAAASAPKIPAEKPAAPAAPSTQGTQGGNAGQGIQSMYELFAGPKNVRDTELNEIQQRIREQGESETSAAQRQLNQLKTDLAAQGTYGKEREAKLKGKEERIGKEEGQAGGLALLEAGLAMMSGTSANALTNIGQGAMAGTAAYRKSLDKIADAKDKLDDAYGRLEDVRFNQTSMNNSEIRKATADVDKAANAGLKSLTDFAVTRYGMSREDAKTMFTGAMQERVANIGASATRYSADRRSADNKDYINAVKGSGAIEQARKNVMEQVMKANKYGTPEDLQNAFEAEWKKTLQLNPELAKLAGTSGGGSAVDTTGFRVLR